MKRLILIIIGLFTIITSQSQDIFDKVIKLLKDCKETKEIIIKDSKELKETFNTTIDSIKTSYPSVNSVFNKIIDKK